MVLMPRQSTNTLDLVANDLALWIDDMASQMALAMSAGGTAPFAAQLTESQKLDYYRAQLFNPDGTPNMQGRAAEMQRLGPEGFATVYKAVVKAYPDLAVPAPPPGATIPQSNDLGVAPPGPKAPGLPASIGMPRQGLATQVGPDVAALVPQGGPLG